MPSRDAKDSSYNSSSNRSGNANYGSHNRRGYSNNNHADRRGGPWGMDEGRVMGGYGGRYIGGNMGMGYGNPMMGHGPPFDVGMLYGVPPPDMYGGGMMGHPGHMGGYNVVRNVNVLLMSYMYF
jgi:hypothetical protein